MNTWGLGLELGLELAGTIFLNPNPNSNPNPSAHAPNGFGVKGPQYYKQLIGIYSGIQMTIQTKGITNLHIIQKGEIIILGTYAIFHKAISLSFLIRF